MPAGAGKVYGNGSIMGDATGRGQLETPRGEKWASNPRESSEVSKDFEGLIVSLGA
jgi:hypothetical protein